jgi:hypothetical protein
VIAADNAILHAWKSARSSWNSSMITSQRRRTRSRTRYASSWRRAMLRSRHTWKDSAMISC